jgi:UDP-2-acetamido-2,6-beta-L-arabino-hexul-4-ose reductase
VKRVLVTGARGFVGKHLCGALRQQKDLEVLEHDLGDPRPALEDALLGADVVFHLAGVNRPERLEDFATGNAGFTGELLQLLQAARRSPKVVLSSSIQAERDNPYGSSKRDAEGELRRYCEATGAEGVIHRLKNLFGKWSRPNYNSVVATFCHNIANDLPIQISDPANVVDLTYIDDVMGAFVAELASPSRPGFRFAEPLPSHAISLGELEELLWSFRAHRTNLVLPDYSTPFVRALYATYLSYLPAEMCGYGLDVKADARGSLAEFIKSPHFGQIFVSRTKPGITRGNHYHHTKTEKFMVVQGEGIIRLRQIHGDAVVEFRVKGEEYRVVDIPPGYTHSIENVGSGEMVTLFWSSEVFDPRRPDTIFDSVVKP